MFQCLRNIVCSVAIVALMPALASAQTREARSSLILHGVLFIGDHHSAQIDGKWIAEGTSIQTDGQRIQIQRIALDHIEIVRDGAPRHVRLGESLHAGKAIMPTTRPTN